MTQQPLPSPMTPPEPPKSPMGKLVFLVLLALVCGGGYLIYSTTKGPSQTESSGPAAQAQKPVAGSEAAPLQLNIAYGTEKKLWMEYVVNEWEKTPAGRRIKVQLSGKGSVEGARAIINAKEPKGDSAFHVWSPASSLYRPVFVQDWKDRHNGAEPIIKAQNLALTPVVYVWWKNRHAAFTSKYKNVDFLTLKDGMLVDGAWGAIAGKPEWGFLKFGHTDPCQSNSGLMALVLMAYDCFDKDRDLSFEDITSPKFAAWLKDFERGVAKPAGELPHSTGTLVEGMVGRGEGGQYDVVMVYENLAIDYFAAAAGRGSGLVVTYPRRTIWSDHPYYILDVPWSTPAHRLAAQEFLEFLLSEPIQREALMKHGFRPANVSVPINGPDSPLVKYAANGMKVELTGLCEPPSGAVVTGLMDAFQRIPR